MSYKFEPAIWSCDTGQRIAWFDRCQLIITWCHISKKYMVNQGSMSLSTYYLEYDRHVARLHRRRHRRAYAPTRNTAGQDNMRINSWVSFISLYGYGAPLGSPSGHWSSAIIMHRYCKWGTNEHMLASQCILHLFNYNSLFYMHKNFTCTYIFLCKLRSIAQILLTVSTWPCSILPLGMCNSRRYPYLSYGRDFF